MFNDDIRKRVQRSVLCWLATVDAQGQPNVSPKEVFALVGDNRLLIAPIVAPSDRLVPGTTQASQEASALRA